MNAAPSLWFRGCNGVVDELERRWRVVLVILAALLLPSWAAQITNEPITGDAAVTARMAVNIVHHRVVSSESGPAPPPTMYREPLPAVTATIGVLLADALLGRAETEEYLRGDRARYLKYHHVFWKALAAAGVYALIIGLGAPRAAALAGALLLGTRPEIDTLDTELEAAALIVAALAALVTGLRRRRLPWIAAAGIALGLAALTKAAILYIACAFVVALALVMWLVPAGQPHRASPRRIPQTVAVLAAGIAAVTLPWMVRNHTAFDTFQIASRAGIVLHIRATHNRMTLPEYVGAFYVWSRPRLRPLIGALTGFDEDDLQVGGRLQRLNRAGLEDRDRPAELAGKPEETLTYYREARAERERLIDYYTGVEQMESRYAERAADQELASRSLESFRAELARHLAMTLPFAWRGAALYSTVLLAALVFALRTRRPHLLLAAVLGAGYVAFHALLTHYETRYSAPLRPLIGAIVIVLLAEAARAVIRELRQRTVPRAVLPPAGSS